MKTSRYTEAQIIAILHRYKTFLRMRAEDELAEKVQVVEVE